MATMFEFPAQYDQVRDVQLNESGQLVFRVENQLGQAGRIELNEKKALQLARDIRDRLRID